MRIGVPREIKDREYRVGLLPAGVGELVRAGHEVRVERGAGLAGGAPDDAYAAAGAKLVKAAGDVWDADLVVKVKEPLEPEFPFLRPELTLFAFLHLAASPEVARLLLDRGVRAIGYETVQCGDDSLPLLRPMSQVAGRMAVQLGMRFLQRNTDGASEGMGLMLGGVPGARHGRVVVLGGGNVGLSAARLCQALGARVTIFDRDAARLTYIDDLYRGRLETRIPSREEIGEAIAACDLLVGAALLPGARAPELLSREMVRRMPERAVLCDVSIDQGGMSETSRVTSYSEPDYVDEGVIHLCVPNLPAAVPRTSTQALTAATLGYVTALAEKGVATAVREDAALARGVNLWDGHCTHAAVAGSLGLEFSSLERLLQG